MPTRDAAPRGVIGPTLGRERFALPAERLARELLGTLVVRTLDSGEVLAGRIVETEAYVGVEDRASHAFGGRRTARTEPMYARPGTAYVYFTYGMHHCLNAVCAREGEPAAVLVRALEPVLGVERMFEHRGPKSSKPTDLCSGPGKLCRALAIDLGLNAVDMVREARLRLADAGPALRKQWDLADEDVVKTPRIGVERAGDWAGRALRFCVRSSPHLSVPIRANSPEPSA